MDTTELVAHAKKGNDDAFADLVRRHQNLVLGYAFNRLGDFHRAQDVVQETFIIARARLGSLRDPVSFPGWLRGIALNCCRRSHRMTRHNWVSLDQYLELESEDEDQSALMERGQKAERVRSAIADLPPKLRDVVTLYYLEERSQKDVAAFLGISVTRVNNDLHASRQYLKGSLSDMAEKEIGKKRLDDAFAEQLGEITRVEGPFVEASVRDADMPRLLDMLGTGNEKSDGNVLVIQRRGKGKYLGLKTSGEVKPGDTLLRRTDAFIAAQSISEDMIQGVVERQRDKPGTRLLETGIKIVDLMTPMMDGAAVGIHGGAGVGRAVLLEELVERRNQIKGNLKTFFFLNGWDAMGAQGMPEDRGHHNDIHGNLENVFLLHNRGHDPVYAMEADYLDVRIWFSPLKARRGIWPAIDPLHSASAFLTPERIDARHFDLASKVRAILQEAHDLLADATYFELMALGAAKSAHQHFQTMREERLKTATESERLTIARADRLEAFFTQPFIVSEAFTQKPGEFVPLAATLDGTEAILRGDHDDTDAADLMWRGAI